MGNPRISLSFSSENRHAIREILAGFQSQNIKFWDYSNEKEAIEISANLKKQIRMEIDTCQYFIAITTQDSVDEQLGRYTRMEVQYALETKGIKSGKIIPVVLSNHKPAQWLGPYEELESIHYIEMDPEDSRSLHDGLTKICESIGAEYNPLHDAHPRLPFWELFRKEVMEALHSNASHIKLMTILSEFNERFKDKNWKQSHDLISLFLALCQYDINDYEPFYPWLVKSICELHQEKYSEAIESCHQAGKVNKNNVNYHGCLGQIYMYMKYNQEAKYHFKEALKICPDGENTDEKINYISILIQTGEDVSECFQNFVMCLYPLDFGNDYLTIVNLQAIFLFKSGRFQEAALMLERLYRKDLGNIVSVSYLLNSLLRMGERRKALEIIKCIAFKKCNNEEVDQLLMVSYLIDYCVECENICISKKISKKIKKFIYNKTNISRLFILRYALLCKKNGDEKEVQRICQSLLSGGLFCLPKSEEDFYYDGLAHYLLGNSERAQYDYERSHQFGLPYSSIEYKIVSPR